MFPKIQHHIKNHYEEVLTSIKMIEIEEKFDLVFSRFFGLYFARLFALWNMTPTQVSLISLFFGVIGGAFLYFQNHWEVTLLASLLITIAGILDSADGQLARMTNQGTELGRIIDGTIDSFVFLSCYFFACIYFLFGGLGWPIMIMGLGAGFISHTLSSAIYDFYKCDFMYFAGGFKDSRIPTLEEVKNKDWNQSFMNKLLYQMYVQNTKNQHRLYTRTPLVRKLYEKLAFSESTKMEFASRYKKRFSPLMTWWALVGGTNTHRTLIMVFSIAGRFDLYLIVCLLKMIPLGLMVWYQHMTDKKFQKDINQLV